jgi:hypothetical protein
MKLEVLHQGRLAYQPKEIHKTPGDVTKIDPMQQWKSKPTLLMPGMHEVPHMDGTHGHVPKPGKPVWSQR